MAFCKSDLLLTIKKSSYLGLYGRFLVIKEMLCGGLSLLHTCEVDQSLQCYYFSSEGIQVGGVGSCYGTLGSWTTIFHDTDDPVGMDLCFFFLYFG